MKHHFSLLSRPLGRLFCILGLFAALSSPAAASDYGCKVLLCLANPAGPKAVAQCVPPITQLWKDLAKFKPFPTCDLASTPNGNAYAKQVNAYYDVCPSGTAALPSGVTAVQGNVADKGAYLTNRPGWKGIGTGDGMEPQWQGDSYTSLPQKTCVGTHLGTATLHEEGGSGDTYWSTDTPVGCTTKSSCSTP